jgi:hypothetical protein
MGIAAPASSRWSKGGRGPRRAAGTVTLSGRARSAPRWTAEAAIAASRQQHLLLAARVAPSLFKVMESVLAPGNGLDAFMKGTVLQTAPARVQQLTRAVLQHHKDKVAGNPASITYQAKQVCERLRAHAGPPGRVTEVPQPPPQAAARSPGWWLDSQCTQGKTPRQPPAEDGRMLPELARWGIERLGALPDHAVLCFERALGRVEAWRSKNRMSSTAPPEMKLLRAIVFTDHYPTSIASEADHFWMVALGRWATATEMMRLFGITEGSHVWDALIRSKFTSRQMVATLGRAVQVDAAAQAFALAVDGMVPRPGQTTLTYASACSGIDLMAVAFGKAVGTSFEHVGAAEIDEDLAAALADIHTRSGLTRSAVIGDAGDCDAIERARPADVWSITPPCESFSRRNHFRSEADVMTAASEIDRMLHYPRVHEPRAIVVENVDEPEARSVLSAALLSLPGYVWQTFGSEASRLGEMARGRRFWVGIRV